MGAFYDDFRDIPRHVILNTLPMKIMVFQYLGGSRIVNFTFFLGEASEEVSRGYFLVIFDAFGVHLGPFWAPLGPFCSPFGTK